MKKYKVIYADPPWAYRAWSQKGKGRSAESHYSTMSLDDIKALPVGELADKDCALFMWITFPLLREAWNVIESWGFTYKSVAFVWVKQNKKRLLYFGEWVIGRGQMQSCVLSPQKEVRKGNQNLFIRLLCLLLNSTVKSRI